LYNQTLACTAIKLEVRDFDQDALDDWDDDDFSTNNNTNKNSSSSANASDVATISRGSNGGGFSGITSGSGASSNSAAAATLIGTSLVRNFCYCTALHHSVVHWINLIIWSFCSEPYMLKFGFKAARTICL
jgi:hypothetical protein